MYFLHICHFKPMTQPNPLKAQIFDPFPTQPNPTRWSTQPMDNSVTTPTQPNAMGRSGPNPSPLIRAYTT